MSQYLPFEARFDAVIFDEASQVFPEDAVPAIARGKQVIVVGDQKQLPPTAFFRKSEQDELDDNEEDATEEPNQLAGTESILDVMVLLVGQGQVGEQHLRTHYRSRSEMLIQFSNRQFYSENPLLVFPDPYPGKRAIRAVHVQDGVFESGINRREAERTVDLVFEILEHSGERESLGVVALSRTQADYIQDIVDLRRADARHLDTLFSPNRDEPFFIKNLENVQGDERDQIIFCIGYGPLVVGGKPPNRFGPINQEGGERRLNVAVSRARRKMTVVHSLRPSDITSIQPGSRLLREYLEYASNPADFFARRLEQEGAGEPESPFEKAVLAALRGAGHEVTSQVGIAGYRIDIGVHADDPAKYILGIECDGYTYHCSPAARDRDWLRQAVLEDLGWTIHRVWSTAWVRNPKEELRKIEAAIEAARVASDQDEAEVTAGANGTSTDAEPLDTADMEIVGSTTQNAGTQFQVYKCASLADFGSSRDVDLQVAGIVVLRDLIHRVVEAEMPIRADQVAKRIRSHWGLQKTTAKVWNRIESAISYANRERAVVWEESNTLVPDDRRFLIIPGRQVVPRCPGSAEGSRNIDLVSDTELAQGILAVIDALHGGTRKDIVLQASREFGWRRTGGNIDIRMNQVLEQILGSGAVHETQGLIVRSGR